RARAGAREPDGEAPARRLGRGRERGRRDLHGVPPAPARAGGDVVIDVLVVDDDYMSASVHRAYAERVPGFRVVGEAHTGAEALLLADHLLPQLVLLDIYLPDISGLDVIRRLRARQAPVDVIAVTAAKDVETLRTAMQGGVVHYLVKPFLFDTFRDRLERYAALRGRFDRLSEANQNDVDHLFSLLRAQGRGGLPKGISAPTL